MMRRSTLLLWCVGLPIAAQTTVDCSIRESYRSTTAASELCILNVNHPNDSDIEAAVSRWNSGCSAGSTTPTLRIGCAAGQIIVELTYREGVSTNLRQSCGSYQANASGENTGARIIVWQYGMRQDTGEVYPCSPLSIGTLLHELGHALGMADVTNPACDGRVMGVPIGTQIPSIRSDDCDVVNRLWTTEREQQEYCNSRCWTTCDGTTCPPTPATTPPGGVSPIIIDLDDDGFHLSGLPDGVTFDIDADGTPNRISWTQAGTGDAFLVLDRNANGTIDDGRELFGNATLLHSGEVAPYGYVALAEYDEIASGGNGDAWISSADAIWDFLQVWTDGNHDAIAQPHEIRGVASAGVVALQTKYTRSNHTDPHGNVFRFKAKALVIDRHGRPHPETTYDVFFVE